MAERSRKKGGARRVLVPESLHPAWRRTLTAIVDLQNIEVVTLPCPDGRLDPALVSSYDGDFTALVIPQPNYFGVLEEVDALTDWAQARGALAIAVVNPMSLAVLKEPGRWGARGVDIVCGDGQPLGVPMSSGGPYFGFLACKKDIVRNMPGRIVGRTTDLDGKIGYTLTLQAREQHIRRAKATSNICTNQGLLVTAATIYMAITGPEGLRRVAASSAANLATLRARLEKIPGVRARFGAQAHFHEAAFELPKPATAVIAALAGQRILAGVALSGDFGGMENVLLACTTETKSAADIEAFATALESALACVVAPSPALPRCNDSPRRKRRGLFLFRIGGGKNPRTFAKSASPAAIFRRRKKTVLQCPRPSRIDGGRCSGIVGRTPGFFRVANKPR
jgi:glycine dehydrogenase subunit 1